MSLIDAHFEAVLCEYRLITSLSDSEECVLPTESHAPEKLTMGLPMLVSELMLLRLLTSLRSLLRCLFFLWGLFYSASGVMLVSLFLLGAGVSTGSFLVLGI